MNGAPGTQGDGVPSGIPSGLSGTVVEHYQGRPVYWKPDPGFQTRFVQAPEFEVLGGGAAGPGKTSVLIALAAKYAQHPAARVIFLRTEFTDLLDVMDRMHALYPPLGGEWRASERRWFFPSGGFVLLAHAGSMTDLGPLLGSEYTAVLFDELSLVPDETVWQMLLSRVRSVDPTVPLRARASANPVGPGREWLRRRFVLPCGARGERVFRDATTGRSRAYVPGTSKDNRHLPSSYWQGLADLPPSIQAALRDGDWDMSLGLFYPELLDRDRLFVSPAQLPPLLDWYEYWGAYDWGFVHPACFASFVRIKHTVYWLDTLYMHRYQDDEQAAMVQGTVERRCLKMVYAGHDAFARRQAHSAAAETVADVFARYAVNMERANIDKLAGAKVLRRLVAPLPMGPRPAGHVELRIVDTPGNRRATAELGSLTPDLLNPNVPAKRDADEKGLGGDDGADAGRYGLATPSFPTEEPPMMYHWSNVADGRAPPAPWEIPEMRMPGDEGVIDRRNYQMRDNEDIASSQFGEGWS